MSKKNPDRENANNTYSNVVFFFNVIKIKRQHGKKWDCKYIAIMTPIFIFHLYKWMKYFILNNHVHHNRIMVRVVCIARLRIRVWHKYLDHFVQQVRCH